MCGVWCVQLCVLHARNVWCVLCAWIIQCTLMDQVLQSTEAIHRYNHPGLLHYHQAARVWATHTSVCTPITHDDYGRYDLWIETAAWRTATWRTATWRTATWRTVAWIRPGQPTAFCAWDLLVIPVQLMGPGIGRNMSCAVSDFAYHLDLLF